MKEINFKKYLNEDGKRNFLDIKNFDNEEHQNILQGIFDSFTRGEIYVNYYYVDGTLYIDIVPMQNKKEIIKLKIDSNSRIIIQPYNKYQRRVSAFSLLDTIQYWMDY